MSPETGLDNNTGADRGIAIGRAAGYRLLAASLVYPRAEGRQQLRQTVLPVLSDVRTEEPELDRAIAAVVAVQNVPLEELQQAFGKIFTHIDSPDCPSHESAYQPGDIFLQTEVMADVAAFYRAHGLRLGGPDRQRPDHIATELEFMSFMARKQAYALMELGPEEVSECERTQHHFLRDHLGCWAGGFAARLEKVALHPAYSAVGQLLALWVAADLSNLGVEPDAVWLQPQPLPPRDDGTCAIDPDAGTAVHIARRQP